MSPYDARLIDATLPDPAEVEAAPDGLPDPDKLPDPAAEEADGMDPEAADGEPEAAEPEADGMLAEADGMLSDGTEADGPDAPDGLPDGMLAEADPTADDEGKTDPEGDPEAEADPTDVDGIERDETEAAPAELDGGTGGSEDADPLPLGAMIPPEPDEEDGQQYLQQSEKSIVVGLPSSTSQSFPFRYVNVLVGMVNVKSAKLAVGT